MAITLFDLVFKILVDLGTLKTGVATSGTTTTLVDTNGLRLNEVDYYNEGTLLIYDTTDDGAPKGEFGKVKDFTQTTKTIEVYDALTAAVAAGDRYGVATRRYPLHLIVQKINNALYLDGYIPGEDTSLTTASNQLEYTLPAGASRDLRQVLFAASDDSDANEWTPVLNFDIKKTATGSQDTLVLAYELPAGQTMWIRYGKQHGELQAGTDELDEVIHPDRIVYGVQAELLRWYRDRTRLRHLDDTIDYLLLKSERAKEMHPLPVLPPRAAKMTIFGRTLKMGTNYGY
jgi:hypothetical protein